MDIGMVILRLIHIFSGIIWVGSTFFFVAFLTPTLQTLGQDAGKVMRALLLQSRYVVVIATVAILTPLSGLLMISHTTGNFNADYMSSAQGIVLSIGALFGLLAAGHGLGVILPTVRKMQALMREIGAGGGPPSQEQMTTLQGLQAKMGRNTPIIAILMVIAVLGMSTFRYF